MRTFASFFLLTFMSLALVLNGPASRGMALSDTTLAELCLNGEVEVVRIGPDGEPTTPGKDCSKTHVCCIVVGDPVMPNPVLARTPLLLDDAPVLMARGVFVPRLEFRSAYPRGPPAAQIGQIDQRKIRS